MRAFLAPADASTVNLPAEKLAEYAGHYTAPRLSCRIALRDGTLEFTDEPTGPTDTVQSALQPLPATDPAPIGFLAEDEATLGGGRLPFVRNDGGEVGWLSIGARLIPRTGD
jgi:hypothetical protein